MGIGFVIGILGGFFGVGGSFLAGPALFAFGMPMNFVVGTDLAHIVGKSIVAATKHRALGNVDMKLGFIMVGGTIAGVETGAQGIEYLKLQRNVDLVVGIGFIVVLVLISAFLVWEGRQTLKMGKDHGGKTKKDASAIAHVSKRVHRFHLRPMVNLPTAGIEQVSVWVIVAVGFVGGVFSGFLGRRRRIYSHAAVGVRLGRPHTCSGRDGFV